MVQLLFVFIAILLATLLLMTIFYWLGAVLMRAPKATLGRALLAVVILTLVGAVALPVSLWIRPTLDDLGGIAMVIAGEVGLGFAQLLISWWIVRVIFQTSLPRAIGIWLMALIPSVIVGIAIVFPLKLFVAEAYVVPSNAMAPTVIGYHCETACPLCQGTLIIPAPEPNNPFPPPADDDQPGICASCRKASVKPGAPATVHSPDRILVNKLLTPERWDVIVFRYPKEPAQKRVSRLVGLPGEKVYIKDDSLWINDVKTTVPADLSGLEYTTDLGGFAGSFATEANPLKLGANEYCVLGDFSKNSSDSRDWGPVPGANIEGVVCVRYWPMERWHVFR
jgi:signal peptidase I